MRSFITFFSLFSLAATSILASPVLRDECSGNSAEICQGPDPSTFTPNTPAPSISERAIDPSTNAERFARGLPPKKPKLIAGSPVRRTQPSPVPPVTITHSGIVEVHNAANGNLLGYISKNMVNGGAQLGYDPSLANALLITFQTDGTGSGTDLDISMTNSNPSWPLLGLIQGRDDSDSNFKAGSYEYGYLGGVANPGTQPGDRPTLISNSYFIGSPRTAETAVWTFDGASGKLTPIWINQDGTTPALQTWTQSSGLYIGGDQSAFFARYPAPVTAVTYKFVPQ